MKDLIERYNEKNEIPRNYQTVITRVDDNKGERLQFRFESTPMDGAGMLPICQYVRLRRSGVLLYRKDHRWFLPGDILFNTFEEAVKYRDGK